MNIHCEQHEHHLTVHITGAIDISAGSQFRELGLLDPRDTDLLIDLSQVEFLDSAGLAALVLVIRAHKSAGRVCVLAAPTPIVSRILKLTAIHQLVYISDTIEGATRHLKEALK